MSIDKNSIEYYFSHTRKNSDIEQRIAELDEEILRVQKQVEELGNEVSRFMGIYQENIRLILYRVGNVKQGTWIFKDVRKKYNGLSYTFSLRVNKFSRLSDGDKEQLQAFLQTKDQTFINEFTDFEKRRNSINQTIRFCNQIKTTLNVMKEEKNKSIVLEQICL